ncbi:UPF0481 protein At3g47200-like [Olea europaea var. sylvestris]|uniref:UPF0481 protein At3g47200-like n=1 Tax=Olea europaea var. sylvestris TaxID=158386 RepID=UPI000C1D14DD|nr:UPF0481 protein At3g47200-like [Olea europaea var. sylvestris]
MSQTGADSVTVNIDNMLNSLSSAPSKPSMFRVSDHLRSINPEAYNPEIIAIGPFHSDKKNLQNMEQHKVWYLKLLLERRKESSVERYVATIRQLEEKARKCYAEDIQLDKDKFVQMLILDGCFIIEFLQNQIPFFIIDQLFNMIKINDEDNVESLISPLLGNSILPAQDLPEVPITGHHLLGIVHDIQCSSFAKKISHLQSGNTDNVANINSALELKEAGISFKKSEDKSSFHIEFNKKAVLKNM